RTHAIKSSRTVNGAITHAQPYRALCHQVELAIAVDVSDDWTPSKARVDRRLKSAIAVAQQHRDRASSHRQVRLAVAVKVAHSDGSCARARAVVDGIVESAVTISHQHGDIRGS